MARGALSAALAAVLLASAGALKSAPAAGVPCSTVDRSNPAYATCDPSYVVTNFYTQLKAGQLSNDDLLVETAGNCEFLEDAFEETFTSNTVRAHKGFGFRPRTHSHRARTCVRLRARGADALRALRAPLPRRCRS
jgi:hypothetical protein